MDGVNGRQPSPAGRTPPPGAYQSWDDYMADVELLEADRYDIALAVRLTKAMRLAPTMEVYRALLEGQPVPVSALDQTWRRRYGL